MKRRVCSLVIAALQIACWVSATNRPFATHDDAHQQDKIPHFPHAVFHTKQGLQVQAMEAVANENEKAYRELRSTLGSRPPSCEHKCGGCIPCDAIQMPTTTDHLGLQYANYEPEGWKCKCGTSFFNP